MAMFDTANRMTGTCSDMITRGWDGVEGGAAGGGRGVGGRGRARPSGVRGVCDSSCDRKKV